MHFLSLLQINPGRHSVSLQSASFAAYLVQTNPSVALFAYEPNAHSLSDEHLEPSAIIAHFSFVQIPL